MTEPAVFQNPLYLHPSDGPGSLTVQEKLNGAQNYRAWRRAIEIGLSTKRKLGFVRGTCVRLFHFFASAVHFLILDPFIMTEPAVFQNPLYLHPSDGPGSLTVQEKLNGAQNYRAWRRAIEIGLSTKRKLGFVRGTVARSTTDANLAELWDTCNNMVICWLIGSVNESIAKSIMFIGTASEIWTQLEKRFALSDGSRRYKLNKDTYEITQSSGSISEYYTKMKCVWEELDSVNVLPVISVVSQEVSLFLSALSKQKEEQSVENACSMLQQEESQRQLFGSSSVESTTLISRGKFQEKCSICGFKWHPPEKLSIIRRGKSL
ncbi:hypothetical protein CTI12_AA294950 [Artemisia annua]|uniref:Retrotransposon Copia-like N-terminal domain-containing protein n=1 Tax=Artemisia annua TaxID=35608 RepID=A0A2U1N8F1_ARTAN|nr:hypothetical protein CTI12_AA294950 [Artemisia annua]